MADCVFCKIAKREIPAEILKETENLVVFADINPKAPTHLLIVPKNHFDDIRFIDDALWVEIKNTALKVVGEKKMKGFRLVNNAGDAAAVKHMHVHLLGEIGVEREV